MTQKDVARPIKIDLTKCNHYLENDLFYTNTSETINTSLQNKTNANAEATADAKSSANRSYNLRSRRNDCGKRFEIPSKLAKDQKRGHTKGTSYECCFCHKV